MKLKRFVAKDMREALTMVKDELGEDAIIMSNKRVAAGVEIVAGIESKPAPLVPQALGGRALGDDQVELSGSSGTQRKNQAYAKSLIEILERQNAMSKEQGDKLTGDIAQLTAQKAKTPANATSSAAAAATALPPGAGAKGGPLGLGSVPKAARPGPSLGAQGAGLGAQGAVLGAQGAGLSAQGSNLSASVPSLGAPVPPTAKVADASEVDFTPARIMPESSSAAPRIINPVNDGNEDMANDSMKRAGPSRIDPSLDEDADLFNTPPLPLSQQREFKNFFVKSKVKQEKDEYVSRAGIDSYRTGSESDAVVRQDLEKMRTEVESIRKLLQFELAGLLQDNRSRNEPVKAMVFKLLHSVGFSDKVADSLVNRLPAEITFNDAWREIVSLLERAILVGDDDIVSKGGIVTLIGPAGVGKTTTLAKLAARFVMRYGPQRVAIVTADHYRIGAVEQIKTYGRIMGCATFAVKNLSELPQLLYTLSDKSLILVDTAGVGFKDERFNVQLTQLKQQASLQLKHYLVLPCTTQRKVLQHAYDHFAMVGLTGLILTKIDECQNLGDALSLCIEMKLPISYITDGQRVPEDLDIPSPSSMARRALAAVEDDAAQGLLPRGL